MSISVSREGYKCVNLLFKCILLTATSPARKRPLSAQVRSGNNWSIINWHREVSSCAVWKWVILIPSFFAREGWNLKGNKAAVYQGALILSLSSLITLAFALIIRSNYIIWNACLWSSWISLISHSIIFHLHFESLNADQGLVTLKKMPNFKTFQNVCS